MKTIASEQHTGNAVALSKTILLAIFSRVALDLDFSFTSICNQQNKVHAYDVNHYMSVRQSVTLINTTHQHSNCFSRQSFRNHIIWKHVLQACYHGQQKNCFQNICKQTRKGYQDN